MMSTTTNVNQTVPQLPTEILFEILSYLSTSNLSVLRLVNSHFREIGRVFLSQKITNFSIKSCSELSKTFNYFSSLTVKASIKNLEPLTLLTNLSHLILNYHHIKIAEKITLLTRLRKITIMNNTSLSVKFHNFVNLSSLDLSAATAMDESKLTFLNYLTGLRAYSAPLIDHFDTAAAHLSSLLNLRTLVIANLDQKNFDEIPKMTKLINLEFKFHSLQDTDLRSMTSLKTLRKMIIRNGEFLGPEAFTSFSALKNLKFFHLNNNPFIGETALFSISSRLTQLELFKCRLVGTEGLDIFEHFRNLKICELFDCSSLNYLNSFSIEKCNKLISFHCESLNANFYPKPEKLFKLTNLKSLKLPNYSETFSSNSDLSKFTKLTYLNLSSKQLTFSDLYFVHTLKNLTVAKFTHVKIDGDLSWLNNLKSLIHLNVSSTAMTELNLIQFLPSLTNLELLNLSNNLLLEAHSLEPLKELKNLNYLNLTNCHLRNKALFSLSGLTKLRTLILDSNTKIYRYHPVFSGFKTLAKLSLKNNVISLFHVIYLKKITKFLNQLPSDCSVVV